MSGIMTSLCVFFFPNVYNTFIFFLFFFYEVQNRVPSIVNGTRFECIDAMVAHEFIETVHSIYVYMYEYTYTYVIKKSTEAVKYTL